MRTYKEISLEFGVPIHILTQRAYKLKFKAYKRGMFNVYTDEQVWELVNYESRQKNKRNHRRKLAIIEFYWKLKTANKVAEFLNISKTTVSNTIKEYLETGCVTVESKLNGQ